jgi:hypothetical protein
MPETIELSESEDGNSMIFNNVKMKCSSETHLGAGRTCHEQFAEHFTTNYDSFANEYPIFQEIKRMAQITGIAKWLKENNIPIDLSYFSSLAPCETPLYVYHTERTYGWKNKGRWTFAKLSGGIDLHVTLSKSENAAADQKREQVLNAKPNDSSLTWDLPNGEIAETCAILKTKKAGNFHLDFYDIIYPLTDESVLCFSRSYDSFNETDFGMGIGWTFTPTFLEIRKEKVFVMEVEKEAPPSVLLKSKNGDQPFSLKKFYPNGTLIYISEETGQSILLYPGGSWHYVYDIEEMIFDQIGNVTQTKEKNGITTDYHYENGMLKCISSNGKSIDLLHRQGRIVEAKGPENISIVYQYTNLGELEKAGEEMTYAYDMNHRLSRFSSPEDFPVFQGSYDDFNRIKTEKWGPVESVNEYSLEEKKIQRKIEINYDELSAIVKDLEGYGI